LELGCSNSTRKWKYHD